MEENKNLVTEEVTEKTEQTAEETQQAEKTYTQEEVDVIVGKAKARVRAKIQKENDRKYGDLIDTLKAGTGKEDVEEITDTFRDFYQKKGINISKKPEYSTKDVEILAAAEAGDIINSGFEEVCEEVDRLADIGVDNMSARDKALFKILAEHRQEAEKSRELSKIGVSKEVYNSQEFKDFAKQFVSNTPIADIYKIFAATQPKKEIKTMGSMKNSISDDSGVKEYYSPEEAKKFTQSEINNNPALLAAIERSMRKW